jgi:hypothetical protein
MDRSAMLQWIDAHHGAVHGDPADITIRCESEVRRQAEEDAWLAAKKYVDQRAKDWLGEWGLPASEDYVAKEICHQLAYELRRHEPSVDDEADEHFAGGELVAAFEPEARETLHRWIHDLAAECEHEAWLEVIRFTDRHARALIRKGHLTRANEWDMEDNFSQKAARIARLLSEDYEAQAHPRSC